MAVSPQFSANGGVMSEINKCCCRICGKSKEETNADSFLDIFGTQGEKYKLPEKLKFCFTPQVLEVTKDDHLPKILCTACCNALDNTYNNAKKIQKFQQLLETKFKPTKLVTFPDSVEKKPSRPTHLNLTLQDLFNHNDTEINHKPIETTKNGNAELLSTPEGPHHEELKDYIATFPHHENPPALISPKNAELLMPSKLENTTAKLPTAEPDTIPTIQWAENEMFPSAVTVSKPSSSLSITSTLKDYRPPPKLDGTKTTGRYATTIYKCQVCTKAFATMAYLEEHMKLHADKATISNQNGIKNEAEVEVECTSCHKLLPNKDALRTHFMVAHHTSGLLHECSACQKLFPNRASVKRHLLTHSTQITTNDFICPICQHSFAHQSLLANHLKSAHTTASTQQKTNNTESILLVCPKCGKGFQQRQLFNAHLLTC